MVVNVRRARKQLTAAERVWRALPKDIKSATSKYMRSEVNPIWREEMKARPVSGLQASVFKSGTSVKVGSTLTLVAGNSNRRMRGGGTPNELAWAAEVGTRRHGNFTRYNRSGKPVTRRVTEGLPEFRSGGYVVRPASRVAIHRISSLHVQVIMRKIHDAAKGK